MTDESTEATTEDSLLTLFADEFQDDDLLFKYENEAYGITWFFQYHKTIADNERIDEIRSKVQPTENLGYAQTLIYGQSVRWEGKRLRLPKNFRAPVLDDDGKLVVDEKTGKVKTVRHPDAGKPMPLTLEAVRKLPQALILDVLGKLTQQYRLRTVDEEEMFRHPDRDMARSGEEAGAVA